MSNNIINPVPNSSTFAECTYDDQVYWLVPVDDKDEIGTGSRDHAYIASENEVYIVDYLRDGLLRIDPDAITLRSSDGSIGIEKSKGADGTVIWDLKVEGAPIPDIPEDKIIYLYSESVGQQVWEMTSPSELHFMGGTMRIVKGATDLEITSLYVDASDDLIVHPGICYYIDLNTESGTGRIGFTYQIDEIYENDDYYAIGYAHGWSTLVTTIVSIFGNNAPLIWLADDNGEYVDYMNAFYQMYRDNPRVLYSSDNSITIERADDGSGTDLTVNKILHNITSLDYNPTLAGLRNVGDKATVYSSSLINGSYVVGELLLYSSTPSPQGTYIETLSFHSTAGLQRKTVRIWSNLDWGEPSVYYSYTSTPRATTEQDGYMTAAQVSALESLEGGGDGTAIVSTDNTVNIVQDENSFDLGVNLENIPTVSNSPARRGFMTSSMLESLTQNYFDINQLKTQLRVQEVEILTTPPYGSEPHYDPQGYFTPEEQSGFRILRNETPDLTDYVIFLFNMDGHLYKDIVYYYSGYEDRPNMVKVRNWAYTTPGRWEDESIFYDYNSTPSATDTERGFMTGLQAQQLRQLIERQQNFQTIDSFDYEPNYDYLFNIGDTVLIVGNIDGQDCTGTLTRVDNDSIIEVLNIYSNSEAERITVRKHNYNSGTWLPMTNEYHSYASTPRATRAMDGYMTSEQVQTLDDLANADIPTPAELMADMPDATTANRGIMPEASMQQIAATAAQVSAIAGWQTGVNTQLTANEQAHIAYDNALRITDESITTLNGKVKALEESEVDLTQLQADVATLKTQYDQLDAEYRKLEQRLLNAELKIVDLDNNHVRYFRLFLEDQNTPVTELELEPGESAILILTTNGFTAISGNENLYTGIISNYDGSNYRFTGVCETSGGQFLCDFSVNYISSNLLSQPYNVRYWTNQA